MAKKSAAAKKSAMTGAKKPVAKKPVAKKSASAKKAAGKAGAKKPAAKKVAAVPAQYGSATPHLIVSPCTEALDFYSRAFAAKVMSQMQGPDGKVMHAEMKVGDSVIMFADEMPPMPGLGGIARKTPRNAGAITGGVMLYVKDVDAFVARAVGAGATVNMPPQDMFWGDRYGQIEDPYGHIWAVATHMRDVSVKEMKQVMAQMGAPPPN